MKRTFRLITMSTVPATCARCGMLIYEKEERYVSEAYTPWQYHWQCAKEVFAHSAFDGTLPAVYELPEYRDQVCL